MLHGFLDFPVRTKVMRVSVCSYCVPSVKCAVASCLKIQCVRVGRSVMLTLCDPTDCSPPDSSVHGILQARILEWVAIPFPRGFSQSMDQTWSPTL